jgi:enoyl-CoA hydratase/carnithine racemase
MENIIIEIVDNIGIMKINRPDAYNALNKATVEEIDDAIEGIKQNLSIRVLIIASDNNFAAGADIKEMQNFNPEEAGNFSFTNTFNKIAALSIPTIAAIDGYALGGGLELALTCDIRIASETAVMGFSEINLGIMPGAGGTVRATKLIGESKAKELIFLGQNVSAEQAERIGLVNMVAAKENLMDTAMKLAKKLSLKAPIALKSAKESIKNSADKSIEDALKYESEIWSKLFSSQDQKEGMKAFLEKRKPDFKGQ